MTTGKLTSLILITLIWWVSGASNPAPVSSANAAIDAVTQTSP